MSKITLVLKQKPCWFIHNKHSKRIPTFRYTIIIFYNFSKQVIFNYIFNSQHSVLDCKAIKHNARFERTNITWASGVGSVVIGSRHYWLIMDYQTMTKSTLFPLIYIHQPLLDNNFLFNATKYNSNIFT